MTTPWFNVRKAAQVAAFFALRSGGEINVLKLTKLIYLADRQFMQAYDTTILSDKLVSMPHGPVNSMTLNYMSGLVVNEDWQTYITDRAGHMVALANPDLRLNDLRELSRAELQTLENTWKQFGHYDRFQLRDYTHQHCPEWEDPHGSSNPIPYSRLFKYLGKVDHAEELEDRVMSERQVAAHLC